MAARAPADRTASTGHYRGLVASANGKTALNELMTRPAIMSVQRETGPDIPGESVPVKQRQTSPTSRMTTPGEPHPNQLSRNNQHHSDRNAAR